MSIITLLFGLAEVYTILIIVYVLLSWFTSTGNGLVLDIYKVLGSICEPYLGLFRKFIPPIGGTIDISPVIAVLALQFAIQIIASLLVRFL